MRLTLVPFALSRALRIIPALAVDTAMSILVLGVAYTLRGPLPLSPVLALGAVGYVDPAPR